MYVIGGSVLLSGSTIVDCSASASSNVRCVVVGSCVHAGVPGQWAGSVWRRDGGACRVTGRVARVWMEGALFDGACSSLLCTYVTLSMFPPLDTLPLLLLRLWRHFI